MRMKWMREACSVRMIVLDRLNVCVTMPQGSCVVIETVHAVVFERCIMNWDIREVVLAWLSKLSCD